MYVRKADRPVFEEAVSDVLLAIRPQLDELREISEVLVQAIYGAQCPDHIFEALRREVMNEVGRTLFEQLMPPLAPDVH